MANNRIDMINNEKVKLSRRPAPTPPRRNAQSFAAFLREKEQNELRLIKNYNNALIQFKPRPTLFSQIAEKMIRTITTLSGIAKKMIRTITTFSGSEKENKTNAMFMQPILTNVKYGSLKHVFIAPDKSDPQDIFNQINNFAKKGEVYLVWIKFRYLNPNSYEKGLDTSFRMAGNQFVFRYTSESSFTELKNRISDMLEKACYQYDIDSNNIELIQLTFKLTNFEIKSELNTNRNKFLLSLNGMSKNKKILQIPISISEEHLGRLLDVEYNSKQEVKSINNISGGNPIENIYNDSKYLKDIHPYKITSFDNRWRFFELDSNVILSIRKIDGNNIEKLLFKSNGEIISRVLDSILKSGILCRKEGKNLYYFEDYKYKYNSTEL